MRYQVGDVLVPTSIPCWAVRVAETYDDQYLGQKIRVEAVRDGSPQGWMVVRNMSDGWKLQKAQQMSLGR